jgi:hypothetical protein
MRIEKLILLMTSERKETPLEGITNSEKTHRLLQQVFSHIAQEPFDLSLLHNVSKVAR